MQTTPTAGIVPRWTSRRPLATGVDGWEQLLAVAKFGCPTVVDDGSVLGSKAGANGQELRAWEEARGTRVHGGFCETVN